MTRGQRESAVPIVVQGTRAANSSDTRASNSSLNTNSIKESSCTCHLGQQGRSSAARTGRKHIIPIRLNEDLEESISESLSTEGKQTTRESNGREFTCQRKVESSERNTCEASRQSLFTESASDSSRASSVVSQINNDKKDQTHLLSTARTAKTHYIPINTNNQLPITRRGLFFDDSFFTGMRQDFQSALNDVLGRWGDNEALTNGRDDTSSLGRYKELREHNLNVESQAVTVTSDETSHKVAIASC